VQVLSTVSTAAAETFLYKHLGVSDVGSFLPVLTSAPSEALMAMLTEILANNKVLYGAAPVKHVFKSGVEELERWALHEKGNTLGCSANHGSPKLWKYRPGPMSTVGSVLI
jgi:hypothetical protein